MAKSLVFTVIGPDRPGLVELLSSTVTESGGNWVDSRMSVLSDRFAGIVLVSVPDDSADMLRRALLDLEEHGLRLMVESAPHHQPEPASRVIILELVGQDRPGIVRDVSQVLRKHGVNIADLVTENESGPMSGGTMFKMVAELQVPQQVPNEKLRADLEALADDIMVDIELQEASAAP